MEVEAEVQVRVEEVGMDRAVWEILCWIWSASVTWRNLF
jgi:hypothetical protein